MNSYYFTTIPGGRPAGEFENKAKSVQFQLKLPVGTELGKSVFTINPVSITMLKIFLISESISYWSTFDVHIERLTFKQIFDVVETILIYSLKGFPFNFNPAKVFFMRSLQSRM